MTTAPTALPSSQAPTDPLAAPPLVEQDMPVVPVVRFWSTLDSISRRDLVRALETGRLAGMRRIVVEDAVHDALEGSLGIDIHPDVGRGDTRQVERAVRRGGLGLIPASGLTPALRPLAVDGHSLVGNERIRDAADWPLSVTLALPAGEGWDQARTWVLVAGGDSFTDRGVYDTVVRKGRGVDFPFDGGTARVTGHGCCDPVFNDNVVPRYVLTGGSRSRPATPPRR